MGTKEFELRLLALLSALLCPGISLWRPVRDSDLRGADMRDRRDCGGIAANDLKHVAGSPADDPPTLPLMLGQPFSAGKPGQFHID
jgi:hypothetical protein